ncbi:unnamed protein product, partial [Rotaria sp. Silwood1]
MMNSNDITKLLRTKPHKYVVKDYTAKKSSTSCWSKFGLPAEIIDEKTNEFKIIDGFASLKDYFTTFVFRSGSKGTGTKNLTDHNCSNKDVNQPTLHEVIQEKTISDIHRTELIDSIANWCAINMRPFHCVEDSAFIIVSQVLLDIRARYGRLPVGKVRAENILPCANTVKRRIQTLAGISRSEVATRLAAAGARGMTAIFVEDSVTNTIDLCCCEFLYHKKSTENVSKSIDAILNEFNIQQYRKSATFVIDRGSNLKAALSHDQIVPCIVHRIHNILLDTFTLPKVTVDDTLQFTKKRKRQEESDESDSEESDIEFDEQCIGLLRIVILTINGCKKTVGYIRKTGLNRKIQEKGDLCLIQENQTRWLSLHAMLNSIDRSYDILVIILSEMNMLHFLTSIDRKVLKDILWFLETFRRIIIDLQAKDHPTLPMMVPCVWYLKDELKTTAIDSSILCFLKNKCSVILEQNIELQDIHFAAAMLNPSYRSLRQATKEEQTRTQKYLRKRLEGITQSVASSALTHSDSDDDHDNRDYLARYVDNPPISRKQDEVFRYLKFDHRETNTSDILEFWKTMA